MIAIILSFIGGFLIITAFFLAIFVSMSRQADRVNPWRNCTYKLGCQCAGCVNARDEGLIDD